MANSQALDMSINVRMCSIQELGEILKPSSEFIKTPNPSSSRICESNFKLEGISQINDIIDIVGHLKEREKPKPQLVGEKPELFTFFNEETQMRIRSLGAHIKYEDNIGGVDTTEVSSPLGYISGFLSSLSDKLRGLS